MDVGSVAGKEAFGRSASGAFVLQGTGTFAAVPPVVARAWAGDTLRFHRLGMPPGDTTYDVVLMRLSATHYRQAEDAPQPARPRRKGLRKGAVVSARWARARKTFLR